LLLAAPLAAQEDAAEESPYRPGLVARLAAGESSATRIDEAVALDWSDAAPDPRLTRGPFRAEWTGRLWTQVAGAHRLAAYVEGGTCRIRLGEREILAGQATEPRWIESEPIELEFDRHLFSVAFEKSGERAQLKLFWSGPGFVLEPIPARFLMHDSQANVSSQFERGRRLATALRCGACHGAAADSQQLAAPALDRLAGNLHPAWLIDWLSQAPATAERDKLVRRMPHFGLTRQEATDVAAWLLRHTGAEPAKPIKDQEVAEDAENRKKQKTKGKKKEGPPPPSAEEGEQLFLTLGCLACHRHGELGESGLFGGGDLTKIADKRPAEFFARWLTDPASLNRHHRMPVFDLSGDERTSLSLWLARQGTANQPAATSPMGDPAAGQRLVERYRCASCHALTGDKEARPPALASLSAASQWARSCTGQADAKSARPGYHLNEADQKALAAYYSAAVSMQAVAQPARGRDLLVELNCLACHAREGIDRATNSLPATLQEKLAAVVAIHDSLGKQIPAMTPPALNSVGDKLHDAALADAIQRKGQPHRPYLMVRMPKYRLTDEQLTTLTSYFTNIDRIPTHNPKSKIENPKLTAAGPRLVTSDGFGCTSCHQVGSVLPDKAPLNARGPSLSMLDKRIRREWFDRWCANPSRIVPRMEMPSVQIPVRGVLGDNVGDQLAAVWHILNTPGFEPPEPNPVRVLRLSGVPESRELPIVLNDVVRDGDRTYLFPLVIGFKNRHNFLYDVEQGRLASWWLGDTARQRTKGKSWYWEVAGKSILPDIADGPEAWLSIDGVDYQPKQVDQVKFKIELICNTPERGAIGGLMGFDLPSKDGGIAHTEVRTYMFFDSEHFVKSKNSWARSIQIHSTENARLCVRLVSPKVASQCRWDEKSSTLYLPGPGSIAIQVGSPANDVTWDSSGWVSSSGRAVYLTYSTDLVADQFLGTNQGDQPNDVASVEIGTGFVARRLPLPNHIMPSGLAWTARGTLVFTTLKGEVYLARSTADDGYEDSLQLVADGLATPYGLYARGGELDVIAKDGLWRISSGGPNRAEIAGRLADSKHKVISGWGVTDDYHDWAVGLVAGDKGEYFIGLPCQQDLRVKAAAKHRGQVLKLVPRTPTDGRLFDIEVLSSGHRFPMGLARSREGELFVTDNQGNYNPFNELNHVRPGANFGFINALEKDKGFVPPRHDKPAIDIAHPWTRSVNGICFLDTPQALRDKGQANVFGPFEGHLIGCEYDTRQLIRMTLQKVGDTYQGAAYPLSIAPENVEDGLLGPIVCAVSPRGELYVGNIRDSGWGAGNNVGDIVQIKIEPDKLPCGIAEVRATPSGFTLDFFRPVDRAKAADAANYSIASYRREATPAYGGPNLDRRALSIDAIEVSPDAKRVTLRLANLREGFVYEFQLKPLVRGKELFHPAEAHYTLNRIPD
jgi:mono/diheme cytochrome c family protein